MNLNTIVNNPKKTTLIALGVIAALWLVPNSYTIVQDGTVKTQTFMGKVSPKPVLPGFHLVNPLADFEVFNTKDIAMKFDKLQVPSQDKFKSTVDMTVMLQFDGNKAPINRINAGNQDQALDKYVTEKLLSTVREFGKSVPKAQDLYNAEVQSQLQIAIQQEVEEYARPYGYTVKQVFLQDIDLPEAIKKQVENTKIREEQVNAEKAELARKEQIAQQAVVQAIADKEARSNAAQANERDADARLYAAKKEAEANAILQRTITPEMIRWKELDVQQTIADKYQGGVPQTVMGSDYAGKVIFDSRK
ncbi:putative SPFH domain-containing protein/band 7 family protein [Cronobacter phage vB_CsaM_SemperBestia]|uniref:Putative SPFH domain-containing protein/band 7 family protein n=1 Tax=Cronobacter phage vB_CsaM_SemperBestia TaxID=2777353 RepID=A0A7T3NB74_9CAUD|nr:putative SPFH domain-containing protein/band 7 family protein [Cronobacter phage vB_CsaM_SemperBestia]